MCRTTCGWRHPAVLFCSDGLWEMVRDQQIGAILTSPTPDPSQTAHALLQVALTGGGADNMSVIVVQVDTLWLCFQTPLGWRMRFLRQYQ